MAAKKTLYILRHAKAENGASGQDDRDRDLIERGVEAARAMGKFVAKKGIAPERILCSTAERACRTIEEVQKGGKLDWLVEYSDKLYLASANETINLIAHTSDNVRSLLIVGHNPGLHQLAIKLAKEGDDELLDELALKFPTCALAAITVDTPWPGIGRARGELKLWMTPKMLKA